MKLRPHMLIEIVDEPGEQPLRFFQNFPSRQEAIAALMRQFHGYQSPEYVTQLADDNRWMVARASYETHTLAVLPTVVGEAFCKGATFLPVGEHGEPATSAV